MNDQRVVRRSLLGDKEFPDRRSIERVCAESVHSFRWKGDESSFAQAFGGSIDRSWVRVRGVYA